MTVSGAPGSEAPDAWSAAAYGRHARFVSDLGAPVLELLDPRPGERILDLGCGDGALTARIAGSGALVTGVDTSAEMVAAARARGVAAELGDGTALSFEAAFDAVFSNAAMHWMTEPDAVLRGVARALRPGGRLVAEFGGHGNVAAVRTALIAVLGRYGHATDLSDIWYFPSVAEHERRLAAAGFAVEQVALMPRPTRVDAGIEAWLATLAAPVIRLLPQAERAAAIGELAALLAPALRDAQGVWWVDYVRLRFAARLAR
ncbi:MAG: class I SAM-dependent methyltransferase [Pikeienuella sp.]